MLHRLAAFSVRHRWLVIGGWLLAVAGITVAGQALGGTFANDLSVARTDSQAAFRTLVTQFPQQSGDVLQVVVHDPGGVDGQVRGAVTAALDTVRTQPGVAAVSSPYLADQPMVSVDGSTALARVQFTERAADLDPGQVEAVQAAFAPVHALGAQVEYGGPPLSTESGPSGSELIGLGAAVLVLLVAFGSVFAMIVPLVSAVLALGLGIGIIHLLAGPLSIGTAAPVVAAMIGLGVGIDYALLVVTRHREGLAAGLEPHHSIAVALATAGRSVLVAGTTVIIAILSLYLVGIPFVSTLGLASAVTVAATLLAAVTVLPAMLAVFGGRLDRWAVRPRRRPADAGADATAGASRWYRWARHVQRRPWPYLVASVLVLATAAVPLLSLRLGSAGDRAAPADSTQAKAYDLVADSFGPGWTGPLVVTVRTDSAQRTALEAAGLRSQLARTAGVQVAGAPQLNAGGDTAVITVVPTTAPDSRATEDLVHRLRGTVIPHHLSSGPGAVEVHVGGPTATAIDLADRLGERLPWFMAFVVGLSMLLLMVEFRSIFLPVKAAAMNLLSVGAAYGAIVAVYQWGWLSDLTGAAAGPIESFAPMMLFAVLFGLSMDYEVFLLSRIREDYVATGEAGDAVATGIAATARVIAAAATVMVVVFASFMLNDERVVNLFGFGLAAAIAVDATIVRLVLGPAVMSIAGRTVWFMPRWLDRALPHIAARPTPGRPSPDAPEDRHPVVAGGDRAH